MTDNSITTAQVGTAVVTGAGSITELAVDLPIAADADTYMALVLLDAVDGVGPELYSIKPSDIRTFVADVKPLPGVLTPPPTAALNTEAIPFTKGLYVKSCPVNMTFTATT